MRFREFAEGLLGSKVKVKLVRRLLSEETISSEREMASAIGVSHDAVNRVLKELNELNLITPLRVGGATIWQLNKSSYAYQFLQNFFLKIKTSAMDEFRGDARGKLNLKIRRAVVFGSFADGRELYNSDIDLLALVKSERDKKEAEKSIESFERFCLQKYGNKLSPIVMTEKEYSKFKNKKLLEEIKKGIAVIDK